MQNPLPARWAEQQYSIQESAKDEVRGMKLILMLSAAVREHRKVNNEIIMELIKRDAGPACFFWEQSVLSTFQKQKPMLTT